VGVGGIQLHLAAFLAPAPLSKEMTLIPRCIAFFVIGTSALGSLAEMTMASTFWLIRELMISIWPSALGVVGPV
jgi:hypothetical protein